MIKEKILKWGFGVFAGTEIGGKIAESIKSYVDLGEIVYEDYSEKMDSKEKFSDYLYKNTDTIDSNINLYNSAEEREETFNAATIITDNLNIDPMELLTDLGDFKQTGQFSSNEEAMSFDATLRELLHMAGKTTEQIDMMMPEILAEMQSGGDVGKLLYEKEVEIPELNEDGSASTDEMKNYFLANKGQIDYQFRLLRHNSDDVENIEKTKEFLKKRVVSAEYNGPQNENQALVWDSLSDKNIGTNLNRIAYSEYTGSPAIYMPRWGVFGGASVPYEQGTEEYTKGLAELLEENNKNYTTNEDIYKSINYTQEQINVYNKQKGPLISGGNTEIPNGKTTNPTGTQNQVDTADPAFTGDEYQLLTTINDNVARISDTLGIQTNETSDKKSSDMEKPNTYSNYLDDSYQEMLLGIKQFQDETLGMYGLGNQNGTQNTITTMLSELKNQVMYNITMDSADLLLDTKSEGLLEYHTQLLQQAIGLLNKMVENPKDKIQTNSTTVNTLNTYDLMRNVSYLLSGATNITSGTLAK